MSSSINTALRSHKATVLAIVVMGCLGFCRAQDVALRPPTSPMAGASTSIGTSGSGSGTFYLMGPGVAVKRDNVQIGQDISLSGKDVQIAGRYVAIVCAASCVNADFFVAPSKPASVTFLAHPSRVPVQRGDAINRVMRRWLDEGRIRMPFDESRGIEQTLAAYRKLFDGTNIGKVVVALDR